MLVESNNHNLNISHVFSDDVPEAGNLSDPLDALWVMIDLPSLCGRVKTAFTTGDSEGKMLALQEILAIPFKTITSVLTIIQQAASWTNGAALTLLGITTATTAVLFSAVLIVCSIGYLTLEWIRTLIILIQTGNFENKEKIHKVIKLLDVLNVTADYTQIGVQQELINTRRTSETLLGRETYAHLTSNNVSRKDFLKARAILAQEKVNTLFQTYIADPNKRIAAVLPKRIGVNAANAFALASRHISYYTPGLIKGMGITSLQKVGDRGQHLLSMVDKQRMKVVKLHSLALGVLSFGTISYLLSLSLIATPAAPILATVSGIIAGVLSTAKSVTGTAYIENTGKGLAPRLLVPKALLPSEGEKTFSIWNNTPVAGKIFYIFTSIITLGGLTLFDGAIYKAKWLKDLRGTSDSFDDPNARFRRSEFTIKHPGEHLSPIQVLRHPILCAQAYAFRVKEAFASLKGYKPFG